VCSAVSPADAVTLWDADTLVEKKRLDYTRYGSVNSVRLDRNGRRMLISTTAKGPARPNASRDDKPSGPRGYEVIDAASGKRLFPPQEPLFNVDGADLSADGEWVAVSAVRGIEFWRVGDGTKSKTCPLDDTEIAAIAFDQDSNRLAAASKSGAVWLLDPSTCASS
jgi:WD40 repeat protein